MRGLTQFENGFIPNDPLAVNFRAFGLMGLACFCDPAKIRARLPRIHQKTFDHLLKDSNESAEVVRILRSVPDGLENGVADFIIGALEIYRHRIEKRNMKPHLAMFAGLKAAQLISDSDRDLK